MAWRSASALALLLLLLPAWAPVWDAAGQAPGVVPRLAGLAAGYGLETWKDEPPLASVLPQPGVALPLPLPSPGALGVYENPYLGRPHQGAQPWLGADMTAHLVLEDEAGAPLGSAGHYVRARLVTGAGDIPAKLSKLGPGNFTAQFDLDGEAGTDRPEARPGPAMLAVDVYEAAAAPGAADRRVAHGEFQVEVLAPRLDLGGILLGDAVLGYADVGPGNGTLVQPRLLRAGEPLSVVATLGVPDAPVALTAWHRARGAVLVEGRTDASGVFAASVDPGQLLGGEPSGLAVVAVHLTGGGNRVGAAIVGVPVSEHATRVVRMAYEARGAGPLAGPLDTLAVGVEDLTAGGPGEEGPARGTLYVLDAGGQGGGSVPFEPGSFEPGPGERTARLPASLLPRQNATYRLLAMLHTGDGRLYSLAQAVRGMGVQVLAGPVAAFQPGNVTVVVRNDNSNLDALEDEDLAFPVRVNLTGLPNGTAFEAEVLVPEGGERRVVVPVLADAGSYALNATATGGEFRREAGATLRIEAARSGIPGFEPALALGAAALALLAHRRRTRA